MACYGNSVAVQKLGGGGGGEGEGVTQPRLGQGVGQKHLGRARVKKTILTP